MQIDNPSNVYNLGKQPNPNKDLKNLKAQNENIQLAFCIISQKDLYGRFLNFR